MGTCYSDAVNAVTQTTRGEMGCLRREGIMRGEFLVQTRRVSKTVEDL